MILAKIPTETAYCESAPGFAVWWDWMVGTVWFELRTPHPVIEPVSDTRVRNGNFRCRDRGPKSRHSRRLREQRLRKPENLADMSLTSRRYSECLLFNTTTECAWWGQSGSNCQLPTQSSNRSQIPGSGTARRSMSIDARLLHRRQSPHPGNRCRNESADNSQRQQLARCSSSIRMVAFRAVR
jgi:hypothetical protein